jgi:hypothetical protein
MSAKPPRRGAVVTQPMLRLRFWWTIQRVRPKAWRALELYGPEQLDEVLARCNLVDPWCRELAHRQLRLWAEDTEAREIRAPLASVNQTRLPKDEQVFSFAVKGWRPDRTLSEYMAHVLGFAVDGPLDADTEYNWGETWEEAKLRIRRAFKAALDEHKRRVESRLVELRPPISKRSSKIDLHLDWLVQFQIPVPGGQASSSAAIAKKYGVQRSAVEEAVVGTAARLGLTLRPKLRPGRPAEK